MLIQLFKQTLIAILSVVIACSSLSFNTYVHAAAGTDVADSKKPYGVGAAPANETNELNTSMIELASGMKGQWNEKNKLFEIIIPRSDLLIKINGIFISPDMGINSWLAFRRDGKKVKMVGELALQENQVNEVMDIVLNHKIRITGLRSHFMWDEPRILFMRIEASGNEKSIGAAMAKVFVKLRENHSNGNSRYRNKRVSRVNTHKTTFTVPKIDTILGMKGDFDNKMYKVVFGNPSETESPNNLMIGGINPMSWAAFSGSDQDALVSGDFAIKENELQAVLRELRAADIKIVSIQPYRGYATSNEQQSQVSKVVLVHYWGTGAVEGLAEGIRNAVNKLK